MDSWADFYDLEMILKKISEYRTADLKEISIEDVSKIFSEILCYNLSTCNNFGGTLYRVRKIKEGCPHLMKSDVWCPPAEKVGKIGRVNDIGKSIFYASLEPVTAIREARIEPGDEFSVAVYTMPPLNTGLLSSVHILHKQNLSNLDKKERVLVMILNDFLYTEFTRHVGRGTEYLYKASCAMGKTMLQLPGKDSLIYPSIFHSKKLNIAIVGNSAKERISLKRIIHHKLIEYTSNMDPIVTSLEHSRASDQTDILNYEPFLDAGKEMVLRDSAFFSGADQSTQVLEPLKEFIEAVVDEK